MVRCWIGQGAGQYDITLAADGYRPLRLEETIEASKSGESCSCGYLAEEREVQLDRL